MTISAELEPIIIIDDFYTNPDSIRDIALNCEYYATKHDSFFVYGHAPYPGKVSKNSYSPKNLDLLVSNILKKPVRQLNGLNSGRFRISNKNDISTNKIHADDSYYAGVLYLNRLEKSIPGTIFYTHKHTGIKKSTSSLYDEIIKKGEDNDLSYWDINTVSYITYNRLIIYPANMFHGIGDLFGEDDQTARLVQLFFWEI